jgi:hypothetical protein
MLVEAVLLLAILLQAVAVAQVLLVGTEIALLRLAVMAALDWLLQLVAQAHIMQVVVVVELVMLLEQVVALLQRVEMVAVAQALILAIALQVEQTQAAVGVVLEGHLHLLLVVQAWLSSVTQGLQPERQVARSQSRAVM